MPFDGIDNLLDQRQSDPCADVAAVVPPLVERLEHVGGNLAAHARSRVGHTDGQMVGLSAHGHAHFALMGRKLEGVGEKVVHRLGHIVGHEVHLHRPIGGEGEVDVAGAGVVAVALHEHGEIGGDVAAVPVGVADGRFDFRDVEQLVDEGEQPVALPLDDIDLLQHFGRGGASALEVVSQAEDDGERSSELVGDVGEEVFPQCRHVLQGDVAAPPQSVGVEHDGEHSREEEHRKAEDGKAHIAGVALFFQLVPCFADLAALSVAFDV